MVNATKIAADFIASLPKDRLSPETTEGREGFVNPKSSVAQEDEATLSLNLCDFDRKKLAEHEHLVWRLARRAADASPPDLRSSDCSRRATRVACRSTCRRAR